MSASTVDVEDAVSPTTQDWESEKFLTFFMAAEEYGIEILKVREIFGMMDITQVPRTSAHILGVLNLRGKVIPVMDLRLKCGMESVERTEETCIIVVQAQGTEMGVVVDRVSEVLDIPATEIQDPPSFGTAMDTEYILGIGKSEGRIKLLLDIDKVLSPEEVEDMDALAPQSEGQPV